MKLNIFPNLDELVDQTLQAFRQILPTLKKNDGVMLAGGRIPLEIYRRAAAQELSTKGILFLSDERYIPVTDSQSNYGTISPFFKVGQASCLSGQAGSLSYFVKVRTELPIEQAALAFDTELRKLKTIPLGLLGLGTDGHTASLFNLQDASLSDARLAIPVIKTEKPDRISVTPALLHKVEKVIIIAIGANKKEIIQTLLKKPETIPAGVALAGHPNVEIWTDQIL